MQNKFPKHFYSAILSENIFPQLCYFLYNPKKITRNGDCTRKRTTKVTQLITFPVRKNVLHRSLYPLRLPEKFADFLVCLWAQSSISREPPKEEGGGRRGKTYWRQNHQLSTRSENKKKVLLQGSNGEMGRGDI